MIHSLHAYSILSSDLIVVLRKIKESKRSILILFICRFLGITIHLVLLTFKYNLFAASQLVIFHSSNIFSEFGTSFISQ